MSETASTKAGRGIDGQEQRTPQSKAATVPFTRDLLVAVASKPGIAA